jgi:hypothetical protein
MDNTEVEQKATEIIEKEEKVSIFKKAGDGLKKVGKKVKTTMSEHPIATFVTGTVAGVAGTVVTAVAVNKVLNKNSDDESYEETDIPLDDVESEGVDVNDDISVD